MTSKLAQRVLDRHLSQKVSLACAQCDSPVVGSVTMDGVRLPETWRQVGLGSAYLCSDICERRWYKS